MVTGALESPESRLAAVRTAITGCGFNSDSDAAATGAVVTESLVGGAARWNVTVYVVVVTSSAAVTTMVTTVSPPAVNGIALVVAPEASAEPSTAMVAPAALRVGVSVPVADR